MRIKFFISFILGTFFMVLSTFLFLKIRDEGGSVFLLAILLLGVAFSIFILLALTIRYMNTAGRGQDNNP
ncbi:MAG: hypothetical protein ABIT96_11655 [Ferruginibacter sp.]